MARGRGRGGAAALMVLLVGLALLGLAFGAGFVTGQRWSRADAPAQPVDAEPVSDRTARSRGRPEETRSGPARGEGAEPAVPAVTFYRELTAPLSRDESSAAHRGPSATEAAPSAMKNAAVATRATRPATLPSGEGSRSQPDARRPATSVTPGKDVAAHSASAGAEGASATRDGGPQSPGFTVQVGAYSSRAQAEALRQALAARGLDVGVSETATVGGTRYRVRVGAYPTKSAAAEAAGRVAADTRLDTYVAPR